jgi:alpha-2-macroglobulin
VDLQHRSWQMLEHLLSTYPEDPAADQAAFAAASALLELGDHQAAAQACQRYARRYPNSSLLDSYWYIIGYSRYAAGDPQPAIEMCRKVAEFTPLDKKTGRVTESANKWPAVYILGQIYHSLGRPAEAIQEYRRVETASPTPGARFTISSARPSSSRKRACSGRGSGSKWN